MNRRQFIQNMFISAAVATPVAAGVSKLNSSAHDSSSIRKNAASSLDRILKTRKIRASYSVYAPYCIKDPNSGKLSGIFVEAMEAIGQKLDLKIDWVEEVGWASIFEGMDSGRHDMHGTGLWRNAARGKRGYFSTPLFYNASYIWTRSDERRFRNVSDINSSNIKIAVQDGTVEEAIAKLDFSQAQRVTIANLQPWSECLLNVTTGKADVALAEPGAVTLFLKKNPGTLKKLEIPQPLRVFPNGYALKRGDDEFKFMIDSALLELMSEGSIEKIVRKYEEQQGDFLRAALPYQLNA